MKLWECIEKFGEAGMKLRRRNWMGASYLTVDDGVFKDDRGCRTSLPYASVFADDWEECPWVDIDIEDDEEEEEQ